MYVCGTRHLQHDMRLVLLSRMRHKHATLPSAATCLAAMALLIHVSSRTCATAFQCSPPTFSRRSANQKAPRKSHPNYPTHLGASSVPSESDISRHVDLQSDTSRYGRGEAHLTFELQPGDVVVYQMGTWHVDGVAVGPGDDPYWSYALVDGLQVVWTHNCEHGVVRGWHLDLVRDGDCEGDNSGANSGWMELRRSDEDEAEEEVEFGPEQVIGRINNMKWDNSMMAGTTPMPLSDDVWRRAAKEQY
mmetsp:Transcript_30376/g.88809  ORF Transcript_30376/g.88809 Transcript_30376/m.88809 type:complete len:247 (+) Transcript_30376:88-828(+)